MIRKIVKWVFYLIGSVVLLMVLLLAGAYWKRDEILEKINQQLSERIEGDFGIGKINFTVFHRFPDFSVTLSDVYVSGSGPRASERLFAAKKIYVDIGFPDLFKKELVIQSLTVLNGDIHIFKTRDALVNHAVLKPSRPDSSSKPLLFTVREVQFKNVAFTYADSLQNKAYRFQFLKTRHQVKILDSAFAVRVKGSMHFDALVFKTQEGPFLLNKFTTVDIDLEYQPVKRLLLIKPSTLQFERSLIHLTGNANVKPEGNFAVTFESDKLHVPEGKSLMSARIQESLKKFKIQQPIAIKTLLRGRFVPGEKPYLDVDFSSTSAQVEFGKVEFSDFNFKGSFTNHVDSALANAPENSKVDIASFKGKMNEFPVEGNATIVRLNNPSIRLAVSTKLKLKDLNSMVDTSRYQFFGGTFASEIKYDGPLIEYLDAETKIYSGTFLGKIAIADGSFEFKPRNLRLEKVNSQCDVDRRKVVIRETTLLINKSPVRLKGSIQNFVPFFTVPETAGYVQMTVSAPFFDLATFVTPPTHRKSKKQSVQERKKISDAIDNVSEKLEFDLDVTLGKLVMKNFTASDVAGRISLFKNNLQAKPVKMKVAGGQMELDLKVNNLERKINPLTAHVKVTNARIRDFFHNFNEFNQKVLVSENLAGTISANVVFDAEVNDQLAVNTPSMRGTFDCKIVGSPGTELEFAL